MRVCSPKHNIHFIDSRDIHYGRATIAYGERCKPYAGPQAGIQFVEGWRAPWGEITQDREIAFEWAKRLDDFFLRCACENISAVRRAV